MRYNGTGSRRLTVIVTPYLSPCSDVSRVGGSDACARTNLSTEDTFGCLLRLQQEKILIEIRVRLGDVIAVRHRRFVKIDRVKTFEQRIAEKARHRSAWIDRAASTALLFALQIDHD